MSTARIYPRLVEELDDLRKQWRFSRLLEGGQQAKAREVLSEVTLPSRDGVAETQWSSWYNERDALRTRAMEDE